MYQTADDVYLAAHGALNSMTTGQVETARRQGQVAPSQHRRDDLPLEHSRKPNLRKTVIQAKHLF